MIKNIRKKSITQEKNLAKKMNGYTRPASGAVAGLRGDVVADDFLVECKYTDKDIFNLKSKIWEKIKNEAFDNNKKPLINLKFLKKNIDLIIIDFNDFHKYFL
jgi:Holliday junction resolvase